MLMQTYAKTFRMPCLARAAVCANIINHLKMNRLQTTKKLLALMLLACAIRAAGQPAGTEPYRNPELPASERAADLLGRLTLEEKVSLMQDASPAIDRLGIRPYNWWNEALHGAARAGLATVFPQTIGMAATFDPQLVRRVFDAVSDEARAKYARFAAAGEHDRYKGLTMWTPNINIFRDPRWGRGMETYGEDPYLTTRMGLAVVCGLQGPAGSRYDKLHACAKHFAVHSGPEWNRHSFDAAGIDPRDLHETYLPAFKALVQQADVKEVMCAYNRFEGSPCCGSDRLLHSILRNDWGYRHIVVSDCGAISDFHAAGAHHTHPDAAHASAAAVASGTDLECGSNYRHLVEAVRAGLIAEHTIDQSVRRLLEARFALGEMDADSLVEWNRIPYSVVGSAAHDSLALDAARRSIVLLRNADSILPLAPDTRVALTGPNANDSIMQWANYNGLPPHTVTILDGLRQALGADNVRHVPMCGHVEPTVRLSVFDQCSQGGRPGFEAVYWNNVDMQGRPVAETVCASPFHFCTLGATVFAPNVELTHFSARYRSTFVPRESGEVVLRFYYCGRLQVTVDGHARKPMRSNHGSRNAEIRLSVESGRSYDIVIDYAEHNGTTAQLDFDICRVSSVDTAQALAAMADCDVVIFAGGLSPMLEGEEMKVSYEGFRGGDRTDIQLPAVQREAIRALADAGKKVILVNCSGSAVGLVPESERCSAIVQAWYPGQAGGTAVADVLTGRFDPVGRLPLTFYCDTTQLPDFQDYSMRGRTYRHLRERPLYEFGFGLGYTTFSIGRATLSQPILAGADSLVVSIPVTNTGRRPGTELVQIYISRPDDAAGAIRTLRKFAHVSAEAGGTSTVSIALHRSDFEFYDAELGAITAKSGRYVIEYGTSSSADNLQRLSVELR